MTKADRIAPTRTHRSENFPVASRFVSPKHRATILAFYRFARAADDIADHPTLEGPEKLRRLDRLEATLFGELDEPAAVPLRQALAARRLSARHPQDLLAAFRLDVEKRRYADWDDLMGYCALSAMPVGRFVLDVHGEAPSTWGPSDALCAALQVINHLQDCGRDFREIDRVYVPLATLAAHGAGVADLGAPRASPPVRAAVAALADETAELLRESAPLAARVKDTRLGMEIAAIQRLAESLVERLRGGDPLAERLALSKTRVMRIVVGAALSAWRTRRREEKAR